MGLQHLPPQQPTVLVLRDVLGYRAGEVAAMLQASEASLNSLLRRARAAFESRLPATWRERAPRGDAARRCVWVPTRANTQPAFACYLSLPDADIARAFSLFVLTLERDQISAITWFGTSSSFPRFGLPQLLP